MNQETIKENVLINIYDKKSVVYLGTVDNNLIMFGYTDDIKTIVETNKKEMGQFILEHIIETRHNRELEKLIRRLLKDIIISIEFPDKKEITDLIVIDSVFNLHELYLGVLNYLTIVKDQIITDLRVETILLTNENIILKGLIKNKVHPDT